MAQGRVCGAGSGPFAGKGYEVPTDRICDLPMPPVGGQVFAGYAIVRDSEAEVQKEITRITDVQQSARGYANYQQWITGSNLEQNISLEDY